MFDGISEPELKDDLYHEYPKGGSRPDFKWENGELKAIIEFKDEKASGESLERREERGERREKELSCSS